VFGVAGVTSLRVGCLCDNGIAEFRPRRSRPVAEILVAQRDRRHPYLGVDPQERAGLSEVSVGPRGIAGSGPMRGFSATDFDAESPVVGALGTESGEHAVAAGELHGGRVVECLPRYQFGCQQLL